MISKHLVWVAFSIGAAALLVGCSDSAVGGSGAGGGGGEDASTTGATTGASTSAASSGSGGGGGQGAGECGDDVAPPNEIIGPGTDPAAGVFTLDEALAELPEGPGPLRAIMTTDLGELSCELYPDLVPNGVANFVGLARGRRPWKDPVTKDWVKRPFYDGLTFHRVIDDFVAQGGDPLGTGTGGPGYKFADELPSELHHVPGTIAYANSGKNTNGSQFYIGEVALPNLDGGYVNFGTCGPIEVVQALTAVATDANDKPTTPLHIVSVTVTRCAP